MSEFAFEELISRNERILAAGRRVSNNTRTTHLNNNDLVIGSSGSGKTRGYVKPNLLQCNESAIVTDTKGTLAHEIGPVMKAHGYRIERIDFSDIARSVQPRRTGQSGASGYNPLDFVRIDPSTNAVNEQDIISIAATLCPVENAKDPFWDYAARMYLSALLSYVMECLPEKERTLESVAILAAEIGTGRTDKLLDELLAIAPESLAARKWLSFRTTRGAERMHASICGIVAEKLDPFSFDGAKRLFSQERRIDFAGIADTKTAVFVTVSDTDRSIDRLVGLFYLQAIQELCRYADSSFENGSLPMPVRFYLDDFATNYVIDDFDNIISVIRSRNMAASIMLQSLTQLESLYGAARAATIAGNCDHWLYLGGNDTATAYKIAMKMNVDPSEIISMPIGRACLFERGKRGEAVYPYDLASHELYGETPEALMKRARDNTPAIAERDAEASAD